MTAEKTDNTPQLGTIDEVAAYTSIIVGIDKPTIWGRPETA
jgi:hypothetical protein